MGRPRCLPFLDIVGLAGDGRAERDHHATDAMAKVGGGSGVAEVDDHLAVLRVRHELAGLEVRVDALDTVGHQAGADRMLGMVHVVFSRVLWLACIHVIPLPVITSCRNARGDTSYRVRIRVGDSTYEVSRTT